MRFRQSCAGRKISISRIVYHTPRPAGNRAGAVFSKFFQPAAAKKDRPAKIWRGGQRVRRDAAKRAARVYPRNSDRMFKSEGMHTEQSAISFGAYAISRLMQA